MSNTTQVPAGWYPNPQQQSPDSEMYWDGSAWQPTMIRPINVDAMPYAEGPPTEPTKTPWFKRKIVVIPAAIVVGLFVVSGIANAVNGPDDTPAATVVDEPTEVEEGPAEEPVEEAPAEEAPAEPAPEPEVEVASGSWDNPMPQPYVAKGIFGGEKYSLTAAVVNADASAQVMEWNMYNTPAPAGFKYVIVQLTMTGIDPDGVEPSIAAFDLFLSTAEGNKYSDEWIVMADDMPSMSTGPTLYPGSTYSGFAAYMVPADATTFMLYDNSNYITF
jgi:hypothetical protein